MLAHSGSIRASKKEVGHLRSVTLSQLKPEREGWLTKRGAKVKSWKKRYFILQTQTLYYFSGKRPDSKLIGTIVLAGATVLPETIGTKKKFAFQVCRSAPSIQLD